MGSFDAFLIHQLRRLRHQQLPAALKRAQTRIADARKLDQIEVRGNCSTVSRPYNGGQWGPAEWDPADGYQAGLDRGR